MEESTTTTTAATVATTPMADTLDEFEHGQGGSNELQIADLSRFDSADVQELTTFFQDKRKKCSSLRISKCHFPKDSEGDAAVSCLASFLSNSNKNASSLQLQSLTIRNCRLNINDARELLLSSSSSGLLLNKTLKRMDISDNWIRGHWGGSILGEFMRRHPSVVEYNISRNELGLSGIRNLGAAMNNNNKDTANNNSGGHHLQRLVVDECDLGSEGLSSLRNAIFGPILRHRKRSTTPPPTSAPQLTSLSVVSNEIQGYQGGYALGQLMQQAAFTLQELNMSFNDLGKQGILALVTKGLMSCTGATLASNHDDGVSGPETAMRKLRCPRYRRRFSGSGSCPLNTLKLNGCFRGNEVLGILSAGLEYVATSLTHLSFGGNQISGAEGGTLLGTIVVQSKCLQELYLGDNPLGTQGVIAMMKEVVSSSSSSSVPCALQKLGLVNCGIDNNNLDELVALLRGHGGNGDASTSSSSLSSLVDMDLSFNRIQGVEGGASLAILLDENDYLQHLHLSGNPLGSDGAQALGRRGLARNNVLQNLHVDYCHLGDEGVDAIINGLVGRGHAVSTNKKMRETTSFQSLILNANDLTAASHSSLARLLKKVNLTLLSLNHNPSFFATEQETTSTDAVMTNGNGELQMTSFWSAIATSALSSLHLYCCEMDMSEFPTMSTALHQNTSLRHIRASVKGFVDREQPSFGPQHASFLARLERERNLPLLMGDVVDDGGPVSSWSCCLDGFPIDQKSKTRSIFLRNHLLAEVHQPRLVQVTSSESYAHRLWPVILEKLTRHEEGSDAVFCAMTQQMVPMDCLA